MGSHTHAY
jgi:hypothetical protein